MVSSSWFNLIIRIMEKLKSYLGGVIFLTFEKLYKKFVNNVDIGMSLSDYFLIICIR